LDPKIKKNRGRKDFFLCVKKPLHTMILFIPPKAKKTSEESKSLFFKKPKIKKKS